ncbi:uncharacterized protein LOC119770689 [Culex quinquefasciatus]|uniref:uncharacterized protein LOC119770689 n=1 Tax=Culex quinquefasciatus TaxID=7176 RepID=UPI0018E3F35A|nr:uncharacterized protein LOC119770689 [Culex quinquefasciatus]
MMMVATYTCDRLTPGIYGHLEVKKAQLFLLVGLSMPARHETSTHGTPSSRTSNCQPLCLPIRLLLAHSRQSGPHVADPRVQRTVQAQSAGHPAGTVRVHCQRLGGPPSVGNIQGLAEPNRVEKTNYTQNTSDKIFPLTRELVGASETVKISDVKKRCTTKLGQEDACIEE